MMLAMKLGVEVVRHFEMVRAGRGVPLIEDVSALLNSACYMVDRLKVDPSHLSIAADWTFGLGPRVEERWRFYQQQVTDQVESLSSQIS